MKNPWLEPRHPAEWAFFRLLSREQQAAELAAYYSTNREMTAEDWRFADHFTWSGRTDHREMMAEDLGLYWDGAEWRHLPVNDAPYAFWLGAEGAA